MGASCRSLYWLDPVSTRPLPLLLQSGQVGLECRLSRPLASSRRKRPNEWSGCRQLASGIISFVARRLIPQLPPPHQSRGAVGTAGAITGWGCARGKWGTGGMQGALPSRLWLGKGSLPFAPQWSGPWLLMQGRGRGALCYRASCSSSKSFLPSLCSPAVPLSACHPAPLLECSVHPSSPSLSSPAGGVQYFLLIQNYSFT